jgi:hypothetical protein
MNMLTKEDVQNIVFETIANMPGDYVIIKEQLRQIREGETVVIPANIDHARFMLLVAQKYISDTHNELMDTIRG